MTPNEFQIFPNMQKAGHERGPEMVMKTVQA